MNVEIVGNVTVVACEGQVGDDASQLCEAVTTQTDARAVVVELSDGNAIDADGVGVLVDLQRWARDRGIQFKVFSPSPSVRNILKNESSMSESDIPSLHELIGQLVLVRPSDAFAA